MYSKVIEIILTTIATYVMFKLLDKFSLMKVKEMLNNANHYVFCVMSWGKITTAIIGAMPVYCFVWFIVIPFIAVQFKDFDKMETIIISDILLKVWSVNYLVFSLAMICGYHQVLEEREKADRHYLFEEGFLGSLIALMLCLVPVLILTPMATLILIRDFFRSPKKNSKEIQMHLNS